MILGQKKTEDQIYIIAEIGNNHEGSFEVASEMVRAAARTGVDAVKFQTFVTEEFISQSQGPRFEKLKGFSLSFDEFSKLHDLTRTLGLDFISTPLDLSSAEFLKPLVTAFKVASSDNTFYPLLDFLADQEKPVLISSGLLDFEGVLKTKSYIEEQFRSRGHEAYLCILHCVTAYPVEAEHANLSALVEMKKGLDCEVGYSDHTLGLDAVAGAVALGARVIEKHFTLDKNYSGFRDHQISADPEEMKLLVKKVHLMDKLLGRGGKVPQQPEREILPHVRRSLRFKHDMKVGQEVTLEDLKWVRPGGDVSPGEEEIVLGKNCIQDFRADQEILKKDWVRL
jgi:N,N'-diacetyllegionaminate synthase